MLFHAHPCVGRVVLFLCWQSRAYHIESGQVDQDGKFLFSIPVIRYKSWTGLIEQGVCQIVIKASDDIDLDDGCSFFIRGAFHCSITSEVAVKNVPFLNGFLEEGKLTHVFDHLDEYSKLSGLLR